MTLIHSFIHHCCLNYNVISLHISYLAEVIKLIICLKPKAMIDPKLCHRESLADSIWFSTAPELLTWTNMWQTSW